MEFISRSFLNKLINTQFDNNQILNKDQIFRKYKVKPYKKEGKTWLYLLSDIQKIGIKYDKAYLKDFRPIPQFEDKYWINKQGQIINVYDESLVGSYIGVDLYEHTILRYYGKQYRKRVHSLMGKVYLGNPQVVNHIDGNKSNNNLSNLERATHKSNIQHAYDNNMYTSRGGTGTSLLVKNKQTNEEIKFPSLRQAEKFTGVDRHRIKNLAQHKITNNTNWEFILE